MNILTGYLAPTEGEVKVAGFRLPEQAQQAKACVGYLPEQPPLYPEMTVQEYLDFVAELKGVKRAQRKQQVLAAAHRTGLEEVLPRVIRSLSKGYRQRVGIAQALLGSPQLLILDEPTAGLDPRERVRFRNLIHALSGDRIVILSTHIVSDIETIAGQIVMFRDHHLYCCDTPANICARFHGKVFQVPAGTILGPDQFFLSEGQSAEGPVLRILTEKPPAGAVSAVPGLEDAFLAIYREEQP